MAGTLESAWFAFRWHVCLQWQHLFVLVLWMNRQQIKMWQGSVWPQSDPLLCYYLKLGFSFPVFYVFGRGDGIFEPFKGWRLRGSISPSLRMWLTVRHKMYSWVIHLNLKKAQSYKYSQGQIQSKCFLTSSTQTVLCELGFFILFSIFIL